MDNSGRCIPLDRAPFEKGGHHEGKDLDRTPHDRPLEQIAAVLRILEHEAFADAYVRRLLCPGFREVARDPIVLVDLALMQDSAGG